MNRRGNPPWFIDNANGRLWLTVFIVAAMVALMVMVVMLDVSKIEMFLPIPAE